MGTTVSVAVIISSESLAKIISTEAFQVIHDYEQRFSRFLPTSELSQLNTKMDMVVSEEFFSVLTRSFGLYQETGGAFNPLIQIARQGYNTTFSKVPGTTHVIKTDSYDINFATVVMDKKTRQVVLQPTQQLDFGGVLKGYLATKLTKELANKYLACSGLIINIGGDLHTTGYDEHGDPFIFYLFNPATEKESPLPLTNKSMVTSGTYKRTWLTETGLRHHILDIDGINNPTTDIISVSVIHEDGALAEALATSIIVRGLPEMEKIIVPKNIQYFIVKTDGAVLTNIT